MSDVLVPKRFANVTPSDSAVISDSVLCLYVGGAGTVAAAGVDGVAATFTCIAGQYLTGRFTLVKLTGTSATGIVAGFSQ
jgi:hypothetical protein